MKLKDIMTPDPITLRPDQTVQEAATIFFQNHVDSAPVTDDDGNMIGLFTNRQIYRLISQSNDLSIPIKEIMIYPVYKRHFEDKVEDYLNAEPLVEHLPIMDEDRLVGIVSYMELGKAFFNSYKKISTELDVIINSTHNLIVAVERDGSINVFNKASQDFFGLTAQEVLGTNIKNLVPTTTFPDTIHSGREQTVQKVLMNGHWFISNRSPIKRGNEIVGAVAVLQDISDFEEIAQELTHYKELNKELDIVIDSSYDGLYVVDGNEVILRVNESFAKTTGYSKNYIEGKNTQELENEGVYVSVASLVLMRKEPVTITHRGNNGNVYMTTGNPIYDEAGRVFRVVCNVRDINELNKLKQKIEEVEGLSHHYETQLRTLRMQYIGSNKMIINSEIMKKLLEKVIRLAQYDSTILITGESGTGKELIAEAIHNNSTREKGPFIKVNCGAIPENLLESELFGYDYGAFTGAKKDGKAGYFQLANKGTLFLDEIGDLPFSMQVKLLRVLQNKEIFRVGGEKPLPIDARIVTGTNRNLLELVEKKEFREDLYYRLNVVPIHVPPLRDRKDDIPVLATHFMNLFNKKHQQLKKIAPEVLDNFMAYNWPGNVRELENLIERLLVTSAGDNISWEDLPSYLVQSRLDSGGVFVSGIIPIQQAVESVEKQILEKAYKKYRTTRQMAKELKIDASTIVRKAAKYGISKK